MKNHMLAAMILVFGATAALAHSGVKNAAVKARMDLMVEVKEATGLLGRMAKGAIPFDAAQAETARAALQTHATQIPAMFEARETDPMTEALPTIWTDWEGFVAVSRQMETAAAAMQTGSLEGVQQGMRALGQSCAACHQDYRIDK